MTGPDISEEAVAEMVQHLQVRYGALNDDTWKAALMLTALRARVTELDAALAEVVRERDEAQKQARMASFAGEGYAHMELRALAAEADKVRAVAAEREACAVEVDQCIDPAHGPGFGCEVCDCLAFAAAAIRARSEGDHPQATDGGME